MKRGPGRQRPIDVVEVPAARPDPRSAEPGVYPREQGVTQKISREDLEEALKRTKSGTRRAVRSDPELPPNENDPRRERDSLPGPRDDEDNPQVGPQVTIVRIDSIEMDTIDPRSLLPAHATPAHATPAGATPTSAMPPRPTPTPMGSMMSAGQIHIVQTPGTPLIERKRRYWATERLQITPRAAFIAGLTVALIALFAACIGFFAGRIVPGSR